MTVASPNEAILECDVFCGEPPGAIHWFKDSKEIYSGKKYDIGFSNKVATVLIKDTEPGDAAEYRCEVSNKLGRVQTECKLIVNSKSV